MAEPFVGPPYQTLYPVLTNRLETAGGRMVLHTTYKCVNRRVVGSVPMGSLYWMRYYLDTSGGSIKRVDYSVGLCLRQTWSEWPMGPVVERWNGSAWEYETVVPDTTGWVQGVSRRKSLGAPDPANYHGWEFRIAAVPSHQLVCAYNDTPPGYWYYKEGGVYKRAIVWLSASGSSWRSAEEVRIPPQADPWMYYWKGPADNWEMSSTLEVKCDWDVEEGIKLEEDGLPEATFSLEVPTEACTATLGGLSMSVNPGVLYAAGQLLDYTVDARFPDPALDNEYNLAAITGYSYIANLRSASSGAASWHAPYWGPAPESAWYGEPSWFPTTELGYVKIGNSNMLFHYPDGEPYAGNCAGTVNMNAADGPTPIPTAELTGTYWEVKGEGDKLSLSAGWPGAGANIVGKSTWDEPVAYQYAGEIRNVNGELLSPAPVLKDMLSGKTWTGGGSSPIFRYAGSWTMNAFRGVRGYNLGDTLLNDGNGIALDNYSCNTPADYYSAASPPYWHREDPRPAGEYNIQLDNPEDYVDPDDVEYVRQVFLQYPRDREALTVDLSTVTHHVDTFETGWQGENCTVSVQGDGLHVTNVQAGARIYKTFNPRERWPAHRWISVEASVSDGTFAPKLRIDDKGLSWGTINDPYGWLGFGPTNDDKEWTYWRQSVDGRYFCDAYCPDTTRGDGIDTVRSIAEQAYQLYQSWSWGIGSYGIIEFSQLDVGASYIFSRLSASPSMTTSEDPLIKYGSGDVYLDLFSQVQNDFVICGDENEKTRFIQRILAIGTDSRNWFEAGARKELFVDLSVVPPERRNFTMADYVSKAAFHPEDLTTVLSVSSSLLDWDPAWWDAVAENYTTEDALFCRNKMPARYLNQYVRELGNAHLRSRQSGVIYARPYYVTVRVHRHYGDGVGTVNDGPLKFYFAKTLHGRINGSLWKNGKVPHDINQPSFSLDIESAARSETVASNGTGNYESGPHTNPALLDFGHQEISTTVDEGATIYAATHPNLRQMGWLRICLYDVADVGNIDLLIDRFTGMGAIAYVQGGVLFARRTYNYGKSFFPPIEISRSGTPRRPSLFRAPDARSIWGVAWDDGTNVLRTYTTDAWTTLSEVTTMLAGATLVRTKVHPLTGVMLVAGWKEGNIIVARSLDYGKTISDGPIAAIAGMPEEAFGLDVAPDARSTWCIVAKNSGGEHVTYWSTDNGLTWEAV
jgi:hypothetical protein